MGYTIRHPWRQSFARLIVLAVCIGSSAAGAQQPTTSPLAPLSFLVGRWTGESEGQPGAGHVVREYAPMLDGRFLRVDNESTYPPQSKNPKGEVHHDTGMFSFDDTRKTLVFRQFHSEGFVTTYRGSVSPQGAVFTSEAIENIPAGFRARESYTRIDANTFEEVFELAEPGKDFEIYSRVTLHRSAR